MAAGGLAGLGLAALQGRRSPKPPPTAAEPDGVGNPHASHPPPLGKTAPAAAATPTDAKPSAAELPGGPALSAAQLAAVAAIQQQLLPAADGCPGAAEIGATAYLQGAVADPRTAPEDIASVIDGLAELERLAGQRHQLAVAALTPVQLQDLLRLRQADDDGAEWLGVMLVFTLEALLGDPLYGGNSGERGWRWLGLRAAEPRPSQRWYQGRSG